MIRGGGDVGGREAHAKRERVGRALRHGGAHRGVVAGVIKLAVNQFQPVAKSGGIDRLGGVVVDGIGERVDDIK